MRAGFVKQDRIDQYVATEKLSLMLTAQPKEYSYSLQANSQVMDPDTVQYMEEDADGSRRLKYDFIVSSDVGGNATYTPYLFIDVNNDGKYSRISENIQDIKLVVKASGIEAERDAENNYIVYKDVEYSMTREIDKSFSGYLKWKLSVEAGNSHASQEGSTLVKIGKGYQTEEIKILQITNTNGSHLNLQTQAADATSLFGKYLAAVPGYKVSIKTVTVSEFEKDFTDKWKAYKDGGGEKKVEQYAIDYFNQYEIVPAKEGAKGADGTQTSPDIPAKLGADMLVLGFGDNYANFGSTDAVLAIKSYMENEKPVLLAHDFIMFYSDANQAKYLRNTVGMDKYGMTQNLVDEGDGKVSLINYMLDPQNALGKDWLRTNQTGYTRSADKAKVAMIEASGKTVAYLPNTMRGTVIGTTEGLSNAVMTRFKEQKDESGYGWVNNRQKELGGFNDNGGADYTVVRLNEGQITSYPYALPEDFKVANTHGQYFQLDMDADDDSDGETDVVVWYALNESGRDNFNPYGNNVSGPYPSDGFYIYNKGNITYTGAGHSNMETGSSQVEAQLFINTLFAAYSSAHVKPSVEIFETVPQANESPINSIAIPYDENIVEDASVLKDAQGDYRYQFINPNKGDAGKGTPIYYRLNDTNFVRGQKCLEVKYYLKVDSDVGKKVELDDNRGAVYEVETLEVNNSSVNVVDITKVISTYPVVSGQLDLTKPIAVSSLNSNSNNDFSKLSILESGKMYGFYAPLSYLKDQSHITIYIKVSTKVVIDSSLTGEKTTKPVEGYGVSELSITKTDLLDLD